MHEDQLAALEAARALAQAAVAMPKKGNSGPKTPEGKARSSMSAFIHGFTSQTLIMPPHRQEAFLAHRTGLHEFWQPSGHMEIWLVDSLAADTTRLDEAQSIHSCILAMGPSGDAADFLVSDDERIDSAVLQARAWLDRGNGVRLLGTYERGIRCN